MLVLNEQGLKNRAAWEEKGYTLPAFDREAMIAYTREHPVWVHFGAGNIFRAFQCNGVQKLLDRAIMRAGIIAVEGFDYETIEKGYRASDNYTLLVTLKSDGSVEKTVIGSIAESCILDSENEKEYNHLLELFANSSLQMASFTITEKGYAITPAVTADFANGPRKPQSYIGKVASLLYHRYETGAAPIAMVSMDNCSHNGDKLKAAILAFAEGWGDAGFIAYVSDPAKVSFPWTMIDKITPRPDASVEAMLRADGLQGLDPVVTSRGTHIAPFVNAEESEYLVIEDDFPNGRPALEKAGFLFTDRDTVNKVERMKVTTCLNPLHTALAVYGCLLGYTKISDEMKDPDLTALVRRLGYQEGLPVVVNPGVLDPKEFIDTVVNVRVPNPFMPDTPQRIATDTSQKLAIRYGETIKSYLADPKLSVNSLRMIPLVQAGWLRYVMAVDDDGRAFEPSPDPMLSSVQQVVSAFRVGSPVSAEEAEKTLRPLLTDDKLFGVDLEKAGLADRVCGYFVRELTGPGAVRKTIEEALNE